MGAPAYPHPGICREGFSGPHDCGARAIASWPGGHLRACRAALDCWRMPPPVAVCGFPAVSPRMLSQAARLSANSFLEIMIPMCGRIDIQEMAVSRWPLSRKRSLSSTSIPGLGGLLLHRPSAVSLAAWEWMSQRLSL